MYVIILFKSLVRKGTPAIALQSHSVTVAMNHVYNPGN